MPEPDHTDKKFQLSVARLATASTRRAVIRSQPGTVARPTITGVVGVGSVGEGAGVASPLTESDADDRTFHDTPRTVTSTDGVYTVEIRDIQKVEMNDANGNLVEFIFDQPSS